MAEIKKVRVKLHEACYVDKVLCQKGDIVPMDEKTADGEPFAKIFGEILKGEPAPENEKESK